jgi:hypothetical protein
MPSIHELLEDCAMEEFFKPPRHLPWREPVRALKRAAMTRPAIERCIWVFIVALVVTFGWTFTRVLAMLGWL